MSNALSVKMVWETRIDFASSTLSGSYQFMGMLPAPGSIVKIVNNSTEDIDISDDGTRDVDFAPSGGFWLYDMTTNTQNLQGRYLAEGTRIFIKGTAGTGKIYLIVLTPGN